MLHTGGCSRLDSPALEAVRAIASPALSHLRLCLLALRMPASRSSAPAQALHSRGWGRPLFSSLQVPHEEKATPAPPRLNNGESVRGGLAVIQQVGQEQKPRGRLLGPTLTNQQLPSQALGRVRLLSE